MDIVTNEIFEYAVSIRRLLHQNPEVGFELPDTAALVISELQKMGIPCTEKYGACSAVGYLKNPSAKKTLAIRADMDALPVNEKTDLPYRSRVDGKMHACGHDAHTAVLLSTAKILKEHEAELPCNVKLIFQPAEECEASGAKMMVENGVMEDVDSIICTHCDNDIPVGTIGTCPGEYMAACIPIRAKFYGKTAHATMPEQGIDAIAMAVEAYDAMKEMAAKEAGETIRYIWSVGSFHGGHAHNVIADNCELSITFRYYDNDFAKRVMEKADAICNEIAGKRGGAAELDWSISTGPVYNDEDMNRQFEEAIADVGISMVKMPIRMSSEDFGWYLTKKPGMIFRFGTRNEALGCTTLAHCNDFNIDEESMKYAIEAFVSYVMKSGR